MRLRRVWAVFFKETRGYLKGAAPARSRSVDRLLAGIENGAFEGRGIENRARDVGPLENRAAQIAIREIGAGKVAAVEARLHQPRADKDPVAQRGALEAAGDVVERAVGLFEHERVQVGAAQVRAVEDRAAEPRAARVDVLHRSLAEVGIVEMRALDLH